ncbi:MAG: hypothetical protein IMZ55_12325 [Acidobacteria bacterium]|nr:hypothetical protein [Acidobacteriota bacterium]
MPPDLPEAGWSENPMTTKPKRGPGRPPLAPANRKAPPEKFSIRTTADEAAAVRKAALKKGLSIQEFLIRGGLHSLRIAQAVEEGDRMRAAGLL